MESTGSTPALTESRNCQIPEEEPDDAHWKQPQVQPTTRNLHKREARMSRTAEVKRRLGPVMGRMKASMEKIQQLEESLNQNNKTTESEGDGSVSTSPDGTGVPKEAQQSSDASASTTDGEAIRSIPTSSKNLLPDSRKLMKASMAMLKKKLTRLQQLEESINACEDRRQNLQHCFLQSSLSKPILELSAAGRRNQELEQRIAELEKECKLLELKCGTVDELQHRVIALTDKVRIVGPLESEVESLSLQNVSREEDLKQQESKINEQTLHINKLECQVEQLSSLSNDLLESLQQEEERANRAEMELLRLRSSAPANESSKSQGHLLSTKGSSDSASTATTEADSDSDGTRIEGDSFELGMSFESANEASSVADLMKKIEMLELENAELKASQREAHAKCNRLLKENAQKAACIHQLDRDEIHRYPSATVPDTETPKDENRRTSFLKKFLKTDSLPGGKRRPVPSRAEMAKMISAGMATPSTAEQ